MSRVLQFFFAYSGYELTLNLTREYQSMKCHPLYGQLGDYYREHAVDGIKEEDYEIYYDGKEISVSEADDILRNREKKIAFFTHISPIASIVEFVKNYE